jgi:hypothetical protein
MVAQPLLRAAVRRPRFHRMVHDRRGSSAMVVNTDHQKRGLFFQQHRDATKVPCEEFAYAVTDDSIPHSGNDAQRCSLSALRGELALHRRCLSRRAKTLRREQ